MYDLTDKDFRSGLVARYLDAETDADMKVLNLMSFQATFSVRTSIPLFLKPSTRP